MQRAPITTPPCRAQLCVALRQRTPQRRAARREGTGEVLLRQADPITSRALLWWPISGVRPQRRRKDRRRRARRPRARRGPDARAGATSGRAVRIGPARGASCGKLAVRGGRAEDAHDALRCRLWNALQQRCIGGRSKARSGARRSCVGGQRRCRERGGAAVAQLQRRHRACHAQTALGPRRAVLLVV
ncbi:hypothetical protein FA09DRAFT_102401 [Tilletiopsis washingtonensis]|jgi:hypothetical protein|uniref:Uncharacterized protein n=1 Tax=Tilletiopsis washingtonensis TaxID=58919 RepID=A0A316Z2H5_9BASI|nr:hypothetical protein FA09DRAFT_102401 [Tilletiopsis washingtonensis]PWN95990.1 hypothetical protein FA09DRAFT_102401 [Tilletiopsis washingtonensis]